MTSSLPRQVEAHRRGLYPIPYPSITRGGVMSLKRLLLLCISIVGGFGLALAGALMWTTSHLKQSTGELASGTNDVYAAEEAEIGLLVFDRESLLERGEREAQHSARAAAAKTEVLAWVAKLNESSQATALERDLVRAVQLRVTEYFSHHDAL